MTLPALTSDFQFFPSLSFSELTILLSGAATCHISCGISEFLLRFKAEYTRRQ